MTCIRCEVVRAKIIANGLGGLRKSGADIVKDLQGRYGAVYQMRGLRVVRVGPAGDELIYEARR